MSNKRILSKNQLVTEVTDKIQEHPGSLPVMVAVFALDSDNRIAVSKITYKFKDADVPGSLQIFGELIDQEHATRTIGELPEAEL